MVGIYAIVNTVNGKMYIGQSINIVGRWKDHRGTSRSKYDERYNYPLYRAIRKYGLENFEFVILEICEPEELNDKEVYWIEHFNTLEEGYNLTTGGGQFTKLAGHKLTKDTAEEIKQLLLTTTLSQTEIADRFGISQVLVSLINQGKNWYDKELSYPLRDWNGGQSAKTINYCVDCNVEISKGATRCKDCFYKNNNNTSRKVDLEDRPSRDELKYLIRTMPFTQIGRQYGVSDNAIRKWCDTAGLPRKSSVIKSITDEEWDLI